MWCPHCQSDVATELAADGQSLRCTACRGEVRPVFAPSLHPETLSARELLERWSSGDFLDNVPIGVPDIGELPTAAKSRRRADLDDETSSERGLQPRTTGKSRPKFRIDAAHPLEEVVDRQAGGVEAPSASAATSRTQASAGDAAGRRTDSAHSALTGPHFDVAAPAERPAKSSNSESLWGQLLAYAGVGVLTIGTVLILWGHFGNVASYASTGWLVATGGQMLLFLGVVTLVSGGMQQTTQEVSQRVEYIGERILRIEHSTRDLLRGPHFGLAEEHERTHAQEARRSRGRSGESD
jgi:hypothetical protein